MGSPYRFMEKSGAMCSALSLCVQPILERLGQMRRLDRCLLSKLGDTLCNGEHARELLSCELELLYRHREQTLADSIQRVGRSWPAARLPCAGDE
jgi:hypothetical protein